MRKLLVAAALVLMFSGHAYAETLFGARNPYEFKTFGTQRGLNQALIIQQVENDGPSSVITSTTNLLSSQSTAADSISNITIECGNDAQCLVDALFNNESSGSSTTAATSQGTGDPLNLSTPGGQ